MNDSHQKEAYEACKFFSTFWCWPCFLLMLFDFSIVTKWIIEQLYLKEEKNMDEKHWTRSKTISILKWNCTKVSLLIIKKKNLFWTSDFFTLTFTPQPKKEFNFSKELDTAIRMAQKKLWLPKNIIENIVIQNVIAKSENVYFSLDLFVYFYSRKLLTTSLYWLCTKSYY